MVRHAPRLFLEWTSIMRAALKWGALIGLGAYVIVRVALTLLATALFGPGTPSVENPALFSSLCLGILFLLFAFSAAGYYAGRETGRAGMGAVAGMGAFIVYAVLSTIYSPGSTPATGTGTATTTATVVATATSTHIASTATAIAHATATVASQPTQQVPAPSGVTIVLANLTSFLLVLGIAALMGWLGGHPGAQRTRRLALKDTPTA
jgi:hypothetical protein